MFRAHRVILGGTMEGISKGFIASWIWISSRDPSWYPEKRIYCQHHPKALRKLQAARLKGLGV